MLRATSDVNLILVLSAFEQVKVDPLRQPLRVAQAAIDLHPMFLLKAELPHVSPLFSAGAPIWYSQFSSDAQGLLNAAVKGQMSVADALNELSSKAESHNQ